VSGKLSHLIARKIQQFPHSTISCQNDNIQKKISQKIAGIFQYFN
jgi:hypothetical protein